MINKETTELSPLALLGAYTIRAMEQNSNSEEVVTTAPVLAELMAHAERDYQNNGVFKKLAGVLYYEADISFAMYTNE